MGQTTFPELRASMRHKLNKKFFTSTENSKAEGNRLMEEVVNLTPYKVQGTDLEINFICWPSLIDGKVRKNWSDAIGYVNCLFCGATPTEMSQAKGILHSFKLRINSLPPSFAILHARLRIFVYVCRYYLHIDFKLHSCK